VDTEKAGLSSEKKAVLAGKRVVITRARSQAGELAQQIEELGGEVLEFPTIEIQPPEDYGPLDVALQQLQNYQWIFFTSVNGVDYFLKRLSEWQQDSRRLEGIKVVAIGPETAKRLDKAGIRPFLVPKKYHWRDSRHADSHSPRRQGQRDFARNTAPMGRLGRRCARLSDCRSKKQ